MNNSTRTLKNRLASLLTAAVMAASLVPAQALTELSAHADQAVTATIGKLESGKPRHGNGWSWDGANLDIFGGYLVSADEDKPIVEADCDINVTITGYVNPSLYMGSSFIRTSGSVRWGGSGVFEASGSSNAPLILADDFTIDSGYLYGGYGNLKASGNVTINGGYIVTNIELSGADSKFVQNSGYADADIINNDSGHSVDITVNGGLLSGGVKSEKANVTVQRGYVYLSDTTSLTSDVTFDVYDGIVMLNSLPVADINNSGPNVTLNGNQIYEYYISSGTTYAGALVCKTFINNGTNHNLTDAELNGGVFAYNTPVTIPTGKTFDGTLVTDNPSVNNGITVNGSLAENTTLRGASDHAGVEIFDTAGFADNTTVIGTASSVSVMAEGKKLPSAIYGTMGRESVKINNANVSDCLIYGYGANAVSLYGTCSFGDNSMVTGFAYGSYGTGVAVMDGCSVSCGSMTGYSAQGEGILLFAGDSVKEVGKIGAASVDGYALDKLASNLFLNLYGRTLYQTTGKYVNYSTGSAYSTGDFNSPITSVYIGDELYKLVNVNEDGKTAYELDKDYSLYNDASAEKYAVIDLYRTPGVTEDDISVDFTEAGGAPVPNDCFEIVFVEDESDPCKAQLRIHNNADLEGDAYIVTIGIDGITQDVTLNVGEIDFTLDFTKSKEEINNYGGWDFGGKFTGCDLNSSGSGWAWYGQYENEYRYPEKTLVLDGLDFETSAMIGVRLPIDSTVVLKSDSSISSKSTALTGNGDITILSMGEPCTFRISSKYTDSGYNSYIVGALDSYSGKIYVRNINLVVTAEQGDPSPNTGSFGEGNCYAIYANKFVAADDADIRVYSGPANSGKKSRGIVGRNGVFIIGNANLYAQSDDEAVFANSIKTVQLKSADNLGGYADIKEYNAAVKSGTLSDRIEAADHTQPLKLEFISLVQVKEAGTQDPILKNDTIDVDLNQFFAGGSGNYRFLPPGDLPEWLKFTADGRVVLNGSLPEGNHSTSHYSFEVADADPDFDGEVLPFDFTVGAIGKTYEVMITCNYGGTVSPVGVQNIAAGDDITITITPNEGFEYTATLDNAEVQAENNTYTISNVMEPHAFDVAFRQKAPEKYTVTVNCGEHGTVTPGTGDYDADSEVTFTAKPESGYEVGSFRVDGAEVRLTNNSYKLLVDGEHTISVTFSKTSSGGGGGHVTPVTPDKPAPSFPTIHGVKFDWDQVVKYILSQPERSVITVDMNGLTLVPKKVIDALQKMKSTGEFVIDTRRAAVVFGVQEFDSYDMDVTMFYGNNDPGDLSGIFGMKNDIRYGSLVPYSLRLTFRSELEGYIANLYQYNGDKTECISAGRVDENGYVYINDAYRKGDYVTMISKKSALPGDADNNSVFNALDAYEVLRYAAGFFPIGNTDMADFNHDGRVDALDASAMLKKLTQK